MKNIAIFASGSGTNAENLGQYFSGSTIARIKLLVTDRKKAGVIEKMKALNIPVYYLTGEEFADGTVLEILRDNKIDLIVLAGFLKLVPEYLINEYSNRIINIHPALLPKYGGKGMYGMHVHRAVIENAELKTGITIHYVNENFDEGEIIASFETLVEPSDTAETVAAKIHQLEMKYFPLVVEKVISEL